MRPAKDPWSRLPVLAGIGLGAGLLWSAAVAWPVNSEKARVGSAPVRARSGGEQKIQNDVAAKGPDLSPDTPRAWTVRALGEPGMFDPWPVGRTDEVAVPRIRWQEVELVSTRELPFRLQLTGHLGEDAEISGIFEAEGAAGPLIARQGDELEEMGVSIRVLELAAPREEGAPARAQARIWDRRTGRELVLPESVQVESGVGVALLAPRGYPGEAIEFLAGEIVAVNEDEFRVERIGLDPASATLRRLAVAEADEAEDELVLRVEGGPET